MDDFQSSFYGQIVQKGDQCVSVSTELKTSMLIFFFSIVHSYNVAVGFYSLRTISNTAQSNDLRYYTLWWKFSFFSQCILKKWRNETQALIFSKLKIEKSKLKFILKLIFEKWVRRQVHQLWFKISKLHFVVSCANHSG